MAKQSLITIDPARRSGKPCIRDTRIAVYDVLEYLANHREEVEQEYQQVIQQAEMLKKYWDKRLQDHLAQQPKKALTAEQAILRAKFQTWKAQRQSA